MGTSGELLPRYEQVIFKKSCLELCLAQLKYPPIQRFSDETYMLDIREALAEEYPIVTTEQPMNLVIGPQGIGQAPGISILRFSSIDTRWSVLLSSEFVSLETREYTRISDLSVRFARVLHLVNTYFNPRHQLRFGLRYINEFRYPKAENYKAWIDALNPELLGLGARDLLSGKVEQAFEEVLTRRDDGHLLVRHGFLKGTTVLPSSNRPAKTGPFYLLDLDYYDEKPVKFDLQIPLAQMEKYNDVLYRIFRWSIGNGEFYEYLRGEK